MSHSASSTVYTVHLVLLSHLRAAVSPGLGVAHTRRVTPAAAPAPNVQPSSSHTKSGAGTKKESIKWHQPTLSGTAAS